MKKLIFITLLGIVSITLFQTEIYAQDLPAGLQYRISGQRVIITRYTGRATSLEIPATIQGLPVTDIAVSAFFDASRLKSVVIPDGVIRIEDSVFSGCGNLERVSIPASVMHIGNGVFNACFNLLEINVDEDNIFYSSEDGVLFNKAKTELIRYPHRKEGAYIIPDIVTNIRWSAFRSSRYLTAITIPNSITIIRDNTFADCRSLESVIIPDSVTNIGESAFDSCDNLTKAIIGDGVITIGEDAFRRCGRLENVSIGKNVAVIGENAFSACNLTEINLPATVTKIEWRAFIDNDKLSRVIFNSAIDADDFSG